jgi:hypothetical protein
MEVVFGTIVTVLVSLGAHAVAFVAYEDAQKARAAAKRRHDHGV